MRRWRWVLIAIAAVSVLLSLVNASWLAPEPPGHLTLVSHGGVGQRISAKSGCDARNVVADEGNDYIENTLPALFKALKIGAQAVAVPVRHTRDGQALAFADATLDCRTNGRGPVADHSLAEVKTLDAGFGYSPDGGRTFPLRGRGIGAIPAVEDVLRYIPTAGITFILHDGADSDALLAAFRRAGVPLDERYSVVAPGPVAARLKQAEPKLWAFSPDSGAACLRDYTRTGWTSLVPASCRGTTIVLPIGERWKIWGWPYRFLDRMAKAGSKVVIVKTNADGKLAGLDTPEQYDKVPARFHGSLWVEDIWNMGPSLRR